MNFKEVKKEKANFKPFYPEWLLKFLSVDKYNKTYDVFGRKITSKHITIISLIGIILIMFFFDDNEGKTSIVVWIGAVFFMFFSLSILLLTGLTVYNNNRIKKICKKYNITVEQWNQL